MALEKPQFFDSHVMVVDKHEYPVTGVTEYIATVKVKFCIQNDLLNNKPIKEDIDDFVAYRIRENLLNYIELCSEIDIRTGLLFLD